MERESESEDMEVAVLVQLECWNCKRQTTQWWTTQPKPERCSTCTKKLVMSEKRARKIAMKNLDPGKAGLYVYQTGHSPTKVIFKIPDQK
jgi:hypothetical protein